MPKRLSRSDQQILNRLARKLKTLREQRGFSQEQLALKAKLSLNAYGNIERAHSIPTIVTLHHIARALKVKPVDLID